MTSQLSLSSLRCRWRTTHSEQTSNSNRVLQIIQQAKEERQQLQLKLLTIERKSDNTRQASNLIWMNVCMHVLKQRVND
jgi:hypothetical protein